jgi:hypothetical protein
MLLYGALFFIIIFLPAPVRSQSPEYIEILLHEAARLKLSEEREWRALLHYGKSISGTLKSKIDDPRFFIATDGRNNPDAELEATLRSYFQAGSKDGQSSICRFPARYHWLSERLNLDPSQLPVAICTERDKSLGAIEAMSAVLVFPVGHINSPASMFGHTLIRIDGSSKSNLISYAVNYSADNTDSNGLLYAWKGLTGMYKGFYSLMPYYDKVREYNDLEHRDMWEYRLNLSAAEVKRMLEHIWELHKIESSYYFLDENCSYNLMFLVEVARPELHLTDKTGFFVLPSDTIRIMQENGIVEEIKYRASQGTRIRKILSLLDPVGQNIAHDIAYLKSDPSATKELPVATTDKIKILDLATGFVQIRYSRKELAKDAYTRQYLKILTERSSLGSAPEDLYRIVEPDRPDEGHGTTRISVAAGVRNGKLFEEMNIRPEFHALLDPDQGYLPGAQIKFMDTAIRYGGGTESVYLKTLHAIDIISISPRDIFFKPISWKVNTGLDRELLSDRTVHLIYRLNTGGGFAYSSPFGGIWYLLGELDINAGPEFRAFVAAAPGISLGMTEQLSDSTKVLLTLSGFHYVAGDNRTSVKASLAINQRITQNNSLTIETSYEQMNREPVPETSLRWNYYY